MNRLQVALTSAAGAAVLATTIGLGAVAVQAAPPLQQPPGVQTQQRGGFLGVSLDDSTGKIVVRNVVADSPAAKAGVQVNDQVTSVNGQTVTTASQATGILRGLASGTAVQLGINRNGQNSTVSVTLGDQPARQRPQQGQRPQIKLPKVLQDLFNQTPQQRQEGDRGSTKSFLDSTGKQVTIQSIPAVVNSVDAANNRVVVTPNGGQQTTIRVDGDTVYRGINDLSGLANGDRVEVQVVQGANDLAISVAKGGMKSGGMGPGMRGHGLPGAPRGNGAQPGGNAQPGATASPTPQR